MKRALAVLAAAATLTVVLAGCGGHRAGNNDQAPVPAATTVTNTSGGTGANPAATGGPADLGGVDSDLSTLDSSLSDADSQLNQADQAADADN
jgi:hypothetical protein